MLKWLFGSKRKPSGPLLTLTFYMRSGNAITINGVTEYTIDSGDHGPKRIELKQWLDKGLTELLISTIDLDQIEAITRTR